MIRERAAKGGFGQEADFAWRGGEISRVEGFSDAVFAFAVTLLVVSLEVPQTFDELLKTMRGFFAFGVSFYMLVIVWYGHYKFFRRYGLQDALTIAITTALLFVILFYVYLLKFLFTWLFDLLLNFPTEIILSDGTKRQVIENNQVPLLMIIYGAGFIAVQILFVLLHLHAYQKRHELELTALEVFLTWERVFGNLLNAAVGLVSVLIAWRGGPALTGLAGWIYLALAPVQAVFGRVQGMRRQRLVARLATLSNTQGRGPSKTA